MPTTRQLAAILFTDNVGYSAMTQRDEQKTELSLPFYDFGLISIKVDKLFDPLRNEEGFKELLKKMGMD